VWKKEMRAKEVDRRRRSIVVSVFIVAIIRESGAIVVVVLLSSVSSDLTFFEIFVKELNSVKK
jgi:hypothetical protein